MAWNPFSIVTPDDNPPIHFNTGTIVDLLTGVFTQGYDGEWYINGGLSTLMYLFQGPTNSYKSTMLDSFLANTLAIYPEMFATVYDTETHKLAAGVQNKEKEKIASRYDMMAKLRGRVSDRVLISKHVNISDVLDELCKLRDDRKRHEKDLEVETPFLNHKGERIRSKILLPIGIDSLSSLESPAENDMIDKYALEDSKLNMLFLNDGKRKTVFARALKGMAKSSGMAFLCTGHTGEKKDLDNVMSKPKRYMQYMKPGQVIKGIGGATTYGAQVVMETNSKLCTTSDNKEIKYPAANETHTNLNEVTVLLQKGKNNASGVTFPFIVTQSHGLDVALTNLNYVRSSPSKGMNYSGAGNVFFASAFTPDIKSSRKNIREHLNDSYELRRAYDLVAQIKFISENVDPDHVPIPIHDMDVNKACEKLIKGDGALIQDIISSRGYWSYKKESRPYMSVYKVLELISKD